MTTRSIHKFVVETLKKVGVQEEQVTKIQIGGPDGDLGSNEILLSKDRTIGMVDKSGVIYDPAGLDRKELTRLAKQRLSVDSFDNGKLSSKGFKVLVSEKDRVLPSGDVIESGLVFRNEFHLSKFAVSDLFVPCGGRPEGMSVLHLPKLCLIRCCSHQQPQCAYDVPSRRHSQGQVGRGGCKPLHHAGRSPGAREGRRSTVQGCLGEQGRCDVLVSGGPGRAGHDRRAASGAHAGCVPSMCPYLLDSLS
jgi:hypothetical protein